MSDERQLGGDLVAPQAGAAGSMPGAPDDEPTLETEVLVPDDEPTLENTAEGVVAGLEPEPAPEALAPPSARGWAARLEHMAAAKQERRRLVMTRFWLVAAPVLVLVVAGMVLLAVFGGLGGDGSPVVTTTTVPAPAAEGSGLLLVQDHGALTWVFVLQPLDGGGVVLAVPATTLLASQGAFSTLAEIYQAGERAQVVSALASALSVPLGPAVVVEWADLQVAMNTGGEEGPSGDEGPSAEAVQALVRQYRSDGSAGPWDKVRMQGEVAEFERALGLDAVSMAGEAWTAAVMGGSLVQGDGFAYLEPDVAAARALLVVSPESEIVSVEVKDGAGVEGAALRAGDVLEAAGFALLPMGYAEGYPNLMNTLIAASADDAEEAQRVRSALGMMGEIMVDDTLEAGHIVVILGKDFASGPPPATQAGD